MPGDWTHWLFVGFFVVGFAFGGACAIYDHRRHSRRRYVRRVR